MPEILGDVGRVLSLVKTFAGRADAAGVDVLLFPECVLQGYLVLGMVERDGSRYYNTAVVVSGGRVVGRYRKTFLTDGEAVFTAGDSYPVFACGGTRFGINICRDTRFPEAAAAVADAGARVLLVPAQKMMSRPKALWWRDRHNEIRAQRARETGMWLVSADVTGGGEGENDRQGHPMSLHTSY